MKETQEDREIREEMAKRLKEDSDRLREYAEKMTKKGTQK